MSWDADLLVGGKPVFEQNYTHNCNAMLADAMTRAGYPSMRESGPSWWRTLGGMSGREGCTLLNDVLTQFDIDPDYYRAYNPSNGWGDFDRLCIVLNNMHTASSHHLDDGVWETCG